MIDVVMPQLGESVAEGTVVAWRKRAGDAVAENEPLCEVTTDKVTFEVPAPANGTLESVLAAEGQVVAVGSVIARLAAGNAVRPATAARTDDRSLRPSPLARRLAREAGMDVSRIAGSGRYGRVRSADVLAAIAAQGPPDADRTGRPDPGIDAAAPAAADGDAVIPFSPIRRQIAAHMVRSVQTAPHGFISFEVDYTVLEQARTTAREAFRSREGFGLTALPFVLFAAAQALKAFPLINASVEGEALIVRRAINLGIAIDLHYRGLVVPVVRNADSLSVTGLARAVAGLARRARDNCLAAEELSGGTFTVTNPGASGTFISVPIINQPQTAILVMDGIARRPAVVSHAGSEALAIRSLGYIGLSMDHRAFDGAYAADFLAHLKRTLQETAWSSKL